MGEVLTHVLAGALQAVVSAWRGAFRSTSQRVVRRDGLTVATACLSAAVFAPSLVGTGFFFTAVLRFIDDDLFWFFGMIIGVPLATFLAACALVGMAAGVTVGSWLLTDRPLARLGAAVLGLLGILIGWTLIEGQSPVASVVGQATLFLAGPLVVLTAAPRRSPAAAVSNQEVDRSRPPIEEASERITRVKRRFVL